MYVGYMVVVNDAATADHNSVANCPRGLFLFVTQNSCCHSSEWDIASHLLRCVNKQTIGQKCDIK